MFKLVESIPWFVILLALFVVLYCGFLLILNKNISRVSRLSRILLAATLPGAFIIYLISLNESYTDVLDWWSLLFLSTLAGIVVGFIFYVVETYLNSSKKDIFVC